MSKESYIGGDYIETTGGSTKIYAKEDIENSSAMHFAQKGDDDGVVYGVNEDAPTITVTRKIIRLEITNEITGYTIQSLKGLDYTFSDPAVVVPTYKVNILDLEISNKDELISEENKGEFNVTRDAWYNLGKNNNGKYELLNRAFIPADYSRNLYGLFWIASYPNISARFARSNLDAFIFTRFGQRKIPAKPLITQEKLDGTSITSPREDVNFATDVMIHVGGTYEVFGYDYLGGSYCFFWYIPTNDIYTTPELAEKASDNDDYDDESSNESWKSVTNQIKLLTFKENKELQVILNERDEDSVFFPPRVLRE